MENIIYKYNVGDTVQIKMTFAQSSVSLTDTTGFKAKVVDRKDYNGPCYKLEGLDGWFHESTLFNNELTETTATDSSDSIKWYKITFYAKLSDEDVKAMNNYFFETMNESMMIDECSGLTIEEDKENG